MPLIYLKRAAHNNDMLFAFSGSCNINFIAPDRAFLWHLPEKLCISGVDADKIKAKYVDGVLRLTLPKLENRLPEGRRLEIE